MSGIRSALADLLDADISLEGALDRHFDPSYRQRTNGHWDDRDEFKAHIAHLRTLVASCSVRVLDEITDGMTYADRHVVDIVKRDGDRVTQEVYVFARLATDGRFQRLEEVTFQLEGSEADRNLANAR